MDARDQVFMSLMKLRLNLLQDHLAEIFHVSVTSQQDYIIVVRHHGEEDEDLHSMAAQGDHSSYNATMF